MTEDERRAELYGQWLALKRACNVRHAEQMKGKTGGAAVMCICGRGCGGSDACSALNRLRSLILYLPTDDLPKSFQKDIELWRSVI